MQATIVVDDCSRYIVYSLALQSIAMICLEGERRTPAQAHEGRGEKPFCKPAEWNKVSGESYWVMQEGTKPTCMLSLPSENTSYFFPFCHCHVQNTWVEGHMKAQGALGWN